LNGEPAGKAFLDIGANGGFMAEAAREAGFAAFGVEPDPASVAYARAHYPGVTFVQGLLEDADLGARCFDVAYCSEVIEHSTDCNRFAAKLASVVRPGGLLYLTTPDIGHWRRPRDLARWDGFAPPAHCLYFSPRNLSMLLDRYGFDVVRRRFAWKPGIKIIARRRAA
jgi:2-polyprenyl-3-methyl-5-hydroxy-6-metoxy-1,4-benzoquinol methylase